MLLAKFHETDQRKTHRIKHDKYYFLSHVSFRVDGKFTEPINIRGKTLNTDKYVYRTFNLEDILKKQFASFHFKAFFSLLHIIVLFSFTITLLYQICIFVFYKNTTTM